MRSFLIAMLAGVAAMLAWFWMSGGVDALSEWANAEQRGFQNTMARTLRALKAGDPGALGLLMSSAFAYGFFHAVGPGHGKIVVGGYGLARAVPVLRLSLIALLASLGQAVTAIVLAFGGLWLLDLGRARMVGAAEDALAPLSYLLIAGIGLWLTVRGARRFRQHRSTATHDHVGPDATCATCGHRHGPTLDEVQGAGGLRDALVMIAGVAVRPCTGALFVLIICWQMGIPVAGIAAAFAMALGTASVTIAVGLAAAGMRGGMVRGLAGAGSLFWLMPLIELAAGLAVTGLSLMLLVRALQ